MNCAVASYAVVAGCTLERAAEVLAPALGPLGARAAPVGAILTRHGWAWLPGTTCPEFVASHPHGRFMLSWTEHYGALIDGPFRFEGAWEAP